MMNKEEFRNRLLEAESSEDIVNIFKDEEENYFDV